MSARRHTPDRAIARIARQQHGLVTRGQLLAAGLTRHQIARRLERGTLWAVHRGVYSVGTDRLPHPPERGGRLVAEHRAVAAGEHDVIVVRQVRRRPGLVPHRHALEPHDITRRGAIPVTTPQRTIADLPRRLRDHAAIKARVLRLIDDGGPVHRSGLERQVNAILTELGLHPDVNTRVAGRDRELADAGYRVRRLRAG